MMSSYHSVRDVSNLVAQKVLIHFLLPHRRDVVLNRRNTGVYINLFSVESVHNISMKLSVGKI